MKALVLSGGGALGAYEAGAIAAYHSRGETFELICGTSIGALNGSFVAQGKFDELATVWKTIGKAGVITLVPLAQKLIDFGLELEGTSTGGPLKRIGQFLASIRNLSVITSLSAIMKLRGAIAPTPIEAILQKHLVFSDLQHALVVSGTNVTLGGSDAFCWFSDTAAMTAFIRKHDKGSAYPLTQATFVDAVRASTSIPFAFEPVSLADSGQACEYVDGGVANNTPIGVAIDAGATDVTVIFVDPVGSRAPQDTTTLAEIGLECFGIMQQKILDMDFASALKVNAAVQNENGGIGSSGAPRTQIKLSIVRPKVALPLGVLQFDKQDLIIEAYTTGYVDAGGVLPVPWPATSEDAG
jgi:predicted acylesterase/phospholipase RssA